jgi:hypothetical protein
MVMPYTGNMGAHDEGICPKCGPVKFVMVDEREIGEYRKAKMAVGDNPQCPEHGKGSEAVPQQTLQQWNTSADKHAPKSLVVLSPDECDHKREYPVIGGIFCSTCRRTRQPESGFESRLVSRLTPRDSEYVHYK